MQGYSEEEKVHIANRYLIPRQIKENGITPEQIEFPEEAVRHIIRHYTREAGVRKLEQTIGTVCRKEARRVVEGHRQEKLVVTREIVKEFLGGIQVRVETEVAERVKRPGVAVGLAWTPAGGDILFIEANKMKGKGGFTMTGQIGEVMQESMQAALTWVRSNAASPRPARGLQQGARPAHPRPRGRHPQGWSLGRRHHGHRAGFAAHRYSGPSAYRDDRRDHAQRQCASRRRHQGEVPRRAPGRSRQLSSCPRKTARMSKRT